MPVQTTEWRFDSNGKPLAIHDNCINDDAAMCVRAMTRSDAIANAETLRPQVEELFSRRLATMSDAPVTAAQLTDMVFKPTPQDQDDDEERVKHLESRSFVFLVYWATDKLETDIIGFARVFQEPQLDALVGTSLAADLSLSEPQREAVQRALFHATQSVGEALTLELLVEKRDKAELSGAKSESAPTSQGFYRTLFMESDFAKKFLVEHEFADEPLCFQMSKDLTNLDESEPVFPGDVEIKPLDLSDPVALKQFFDVLKMAFGPSTPTFEAWKIHYPQQPRFAPELSFAAWSKTDNEPVAVIAIERLVDDEGGGHDEVTAVCATSAKLLAHAQRTSTDGVDAQGESVAVNEDLQQLLDAASSPTLMFSADHDEKKAAIEQRATVAYVCGAATKVEYRSKGLSSSLLRHAFRAAAATSSLWEITLGVDAVNKSAVRAYQRAGMVVTKTFGPSLLVKQVSLQP